MNFSIKILKNCYVYKNISNWIGLDGLFDSLELWFVGSGNGEKGRDSIVTHTFVLL